MSYHSESDNMMSESVEQFKELARQIEGEEHGRGDEREPDSEREYRRSNFERERKLDSTHSSRYQPYSTSRPDRESRSSKKEHRVYVYNLPFSLKWQDLKDHMKKAGDVVFAEIMEDSTGKSKGCGIVEFTSTEDAQRAIRELNDSDLRGRLMKIREDQQDRDDRPRRPRDRDRSSRDRDHSSSGSLGSVAGLSMLGLGQFGLLQQMSSKSDTASCSVFVSNLDYRVTWAKLKDTFKAAGRVVRADVAEDHDKKSKGHGTVQFETPLEAINAVFIMNGKSIYDRSMNVRLDRESPYFSMFGGNDGGKTSSTLAATASLQSMPNLNSLTSLAGLSGMGGMGGLGGGVSPLALLQLQSLQSQMSGLGGMASLNNMAGLSGFGGLGTAAMNLGTGATAGSFQSSQGLSAADTSSLGGYSNTSALNTANGSGLGASAMSNPYALWMQQLYGMQGYGGTQASYGTATETQPQVKGDPAKQVFVRNLPWKVTWQDLKDKFREAGRVVRADVLMDDSKRSKGCGTVLFESAEEASRAVLSFNGTVMDGREIEVRMDRG